MTSKQRPAPLPPQHEFPAFPQTVDQLLTIPQAARQLAISESKFYRLLRDRHSGLPVMRLPGHTTRIPAARLQLWIEQHTTPAGDPSRSRR